METNLFNQKYDSFRTTSYFFSAMLLISLLLFGCKTPQNTVQIKVNSREIAQGQDVTFTWNITEKGVKSVSIEGIEEGLPTEGTITLKPDTTVTYKFVIEKEKDKPLKRSYTIDVKVPKISTFKAPEFTTDEKPVKIEWRVENVSSVKLEGFRENLKPQGELVLNLDTTTEFILVAENEYKVRVEKRLTVNVDVIEGFEAPAEVYLGDTAIIYWKFKKAKNVLVEQMTGKFNAEGSLKLLPRQTTTYNFTVVGDNRADRKIDHTVRVLPPDIIYFSAPKTINKGSEARLTWLVKGKADIQIIGVRDSLPAQGQLNVKPVKTQTYDLIIRGNKIEKKRTVVVNVVERRNLIKDERQFNKEKKDMRFDCEIFAVDQSNYPAEVKLLVLAVDNEGFFMNGMAPPFLDIEKSKQYFKSLVEVVGGKEYPITAFKITEIHDKSPKKYDIAMALDYTASMKGDNIEKLEQGITTFVQKKNAIDRIGLVTFSDTFKIRAKPNTDAEALLAEANFNGTTEEEGRTALYAGAGAGMALLDSLQQAKLMILFTDGHENASFLYHGQGITTAEEILLTARQQKIRIVVIALGDEINTLLLKKIANYSGANIYEINRTDELPMVFDEIRHLLRNYYEISYKPVNLAGSHEVRLVYNNLVNNNSIVKTEWFAGDDFNLQAIEHPKNSYWSEFKGKNGNLSPITQPQAVAFFRFDKSNLDAAYKPALSKYVDYLNNNPTVEAVIFGHTDSKGSDSYCMQLAERRAEIIKQYFVEKGIEADRINIKGLGKTAPLWKAEEFDWQAQENRRIEILLLKQ